MPGMHKPGGSAVGGAASADAICECLAAEIEALKECDAELHDALCEKLESDDGSAIDKLCEIAVNTQAITGLESAFAQIGCIKNAETGEQTGTVLACKITDTTTEPPSTTIEVWAFLSTGEVIKGYDGPYEPCTNIDELIEKSCEIRDLLEQVKTNCSTDQIPDANYDGAIAWVTGRPNTGVVWQLIDNRDPLNQIVVASGNNFGEFISNMESLGYTEWSVGETHYFCPCPSGLVNAGDYFVTADGGTVSKPACLALAEVPGAPDKPADDDACALGTIGCNDDRRDDLLNTIAEKACAGKYPCLQCSRVAVAEMAVIAAFDQAGLQQEFPQPVTGGLALAAALQNQGYVIDSATESTVEVCGPKILTAVLLEDGTAVEAVVIDSKEGELVCDPALINALQGGFQQLCLKQDKTNDLLEQLLCCFKRPADPCPLLTDGAEGSNFTYVGGPATGDAVTFPAGHETNGGFNGTTDFSTVLSADQAQFEACYGTDCTTVTLRLDAEHKSYGVSHSGFFWSLAGAMATAISTTTTMTFTTGGTNAPMGPNAGQPDENEWVPRWVEWTLPKSVLFAGTPLRTIAFESFNGSDGAGEDIQNISITVTGVN